MPQPSPESAATIIQCNQRFVHALLHDPEFALAEMEIALKELDEKHTARALEFEQVREALRNLDKEHERATRTSSPAG